MEPKTSIRFLTTVALILLSLTVLSCSNNNVCTYMPPNEGVVSFKDFYVSSNSTELNTFARGTIFVEKDKSDNYTAQIVAWIEIDPMDFGGVGFSIPFGWEVTNLIGSYPDIGNNTWMSCPFENDPVEGDRDPLNWRQWIAIGSQHYSYISSGGGSGSVIIELAAYPKGQKPSETLAIMVAVGSDESDEVITIGVCDDEECSNPPQQEGYKIMYPDFELIEVPISQYDQ
jgi:hypothetical protein